MTLSVLERKVTALLEQLACTLLCVNGAYGPRVGILRVICAESIYTKTNAVVLIKVLKSFGKRFRLLVSFSCPHSLDLNIPNGCLSLFHMAVWGVDFVCLFFTIAMVYYQLEPSAFSILYECRYRNMTLSSSEWVFTGTLTQAIHLLGPWSCSASQQAHIIMPLNASVTWEQRSPVSLLVLLLWCIRDQ